MGQSIKCLLHKHEDIMLDNQHQVKIHEWWQFQFWGGFLGLPASQSSEIQEPDLKGWWKAMSNDIDL